MTGFDATIIGAGAVGLACAAALGAAGQSVLVLEGERIPGMGNSSRNSEVIHAGLYYSKNSLKHLLCIAGRRNLYPFLEKHGVAHRRCGKIVVATNAAEEAAIMQLAARAQDNGVEKLRPITASEARAKEPELNCTAALFSAETGIFDSHEYLKALEGEIGAAGGHVVYRTPFRHASVTADGFRVVTGGDNPADFITRRLINSAGLGAMHVARHIDGLDAQHVPKLFLARGAYFRLRGRGPFSHLVYPAPVDGGLGVHATLDLAGRMRFGPDVEWLGEASADGTPLDFGVDPGRAESFYDAIRKYWPHLKDGALAADYAGIRPKLSGPGQPAAEFRIDGPEVHGIRGLVNLFGIESTGLTSSLAIADQVGSMLK